MRDRLDVRRRTLPTPRRAAAFGARYLGDMRAVFERHGGTVEAYPGDALMAVFGVPVLHDDDALRALRAAVEFQEMLPGLADELDEAFGVRLTTRIGLGTGEVIAEPPAPGRPPASGHAVNAAKRLEEAAGAGEILIDDATHRLVRDFVDAEPADLGSRVLELRASAERPRKLDSPLVGRAQQIEGLSSAVAAAVADRACHLVTVLGAAGVGKSRLVDDFVDGLGGRASRPARPLPALRRGHHVLAARGGRPRSDRRRRGTAGRRAPAKPSPLGSPTTRRPS